MLTNGRGRWEVSQEPKLIQYQFNKNAEILSVVVYVMQREDLLANSQSSSYTFMIYY